MYLPLFRVHDPRQWMPSPLFGPMMTLDRVAPFSRMKTASDSPVSVCPSHVFADSRLVFLGECRRGSSKERHTTSVPLLQPAVKVCICGNGPRRWEIGGTRGFWEDRPQSSVSCCTSLVWMLELASCEARESSHQESRAEHVESKSEDDR